MSTISSELEAFYTYLKKRLEADAEYLGYLIAHSGELGAQRERLVRQWFARYLPAPYAIRSGFLLELKAVEEQVDFGEMSRQCDLLITDLAQHFPLFEDENVSVLTPDSVRAVVEIKTWLDEARLREAFETIASAKAVARAAGLRGGLPGVVLGLGRNISKEHFRQTLRALLQECIQAVREPPDGLAILSAWEERGYWVGVEVRSTGQVEVQGYATSQPLPWVLHATLKALNAPQAKLILSAFYELAYRSSDQDETMSFTVEPGGEL